MNIITPTIVEKRAALIAKIGIALALSVALLAIYGWLSHTVVLVQIRPQYSSMKFNSALGVITAALALLAADRQHRKTCVIIVLLGLIVPLGTLLEYVANTDIGIDEFFVIPFLDAKVRYIGRMAPNTTVGHIILHLTILGYALLQPLKQKHELLIVLLGSVIVALGTVPLIGYMGGIQSAHTWGKYAGMALQTALCFVLLGGSLIASVWKKSHGIPHWLHIPVAIGFLIMAISIWVAVREYEDIRFEDALQVEATYISARGGDRLTAFYAAVDRIGNRWVVAGGTPRPIWESDAGTYLKGYPFLRTLEWVDRNDILQWMIPKTENQLPTNGPLNASGTRAETRKQAMETRIGQVTQLVDLVQGGKGFLYMSPLYIRDKFDGVIVAAFNADEVFSKILARDKSGSFYVTVREDSNIVFTNAPADFELSERWQKTAVMQNRGRSWMINVSPTPEMFAGKNSPLQLLVLITGLLTSVFATFSVLLAFKSQRTALALKTNEERLHQIIATHSILSSADFNLHNMMSDVVQRVLTLTQATGAVIELAEDEEMVYQSTSGTLSSYLGLRIKRAGSLSGMCVEKSQILISDDTNVDPRVNAEACRKVGAISMAVVPLVQRGTVVGVLKVVSPHTHAFHDQDIQTLQLISGLLGGALGQQLEIERRQKVEEKLLYMAQNDSLTNLPNRMLFNDRLSHAILNNTRNGGTLAVMFMDIDHFKTINDVHGHAHGDALLKQFAERTGLVLRKGDTLARLGGDEFTLIAENLKAVSDAGNIAQKIIEAARQPFDLLGLKLNISVSIGVAIASKTETDATTIVARADEALYETKRAGRDGYRIISL